jgi:hypothetical protein
MATYIPGITDYIPQAQPFRPDFNMLGNMLQTKQSRYDANHKQLSSIYSTLLNSPLMRDENISKRDMFFKSVDQSIQRISGLDLSLDQNVEAAKSIFKGFYEDKDLIKDMTWTKNYYNQKERSQAMRNCIKPDECGGSWWDGGDKYLDYKAQEFKNATKEEALGFENVNYVAAQDFQDKAMKAAKDAGFKVVYDDVKGDWIVKTTNGTEMVKPLSEFYVSKFGEEPGMMEYLKANTYVNRKDWVASNLSNYQSEDEANMAYIQEYYNQVEQSISNGKKEAQTNADVANQKSKDIDQHVKTTGVLPQSDDWLGQWGDTKAEVEDTEKNVKVYDEAANSMKVFKNNIGNMKAYLSYFDNSAAIDLLKRKSLLAASEYANLTTEREFKENPIAKAAREHAWDLEKTRMKEGYIDPRTNEYVPGTDVRGQMMMKDYEAKKKKEEEAAIAAAEKAIKINPQIVDKGNTATPITDKAQAVRLNKEQSVKSLLDVQSAMNSSIDNSVIAMQDALASDPSQRTSMLNVLKDVLGPNTNINPIKLLDKDPEEFEKLKGLSLTQKDIINTKFKKYTDASTADGQVYSKWFDANRAALTQDAANYNNALADYKAITAHVEKGRLAAKNEYEGFINNEITSKKLDGEDLMERTIIKEALQNSVSMGFADGDVDAFAREWAAKNQNRFQGGSVKKVGEQDVIVNKYKVKNPILKTLTKQDEAYEFAKEALEKGKASFDGYEMLKTPAWDAMDPNMPKGTNAKATKTYVANVTPWDISNPQSSQDAQDLIELLTATKKAIIENNAVVRPENDFSLDEEYTYKDSDKGAVAKLNQYIADLESGDKEKIKNITSEFQFSRISGNRYGKSYIYLNPNESWNQIYRTGEEKKSPLFTTNEDKELLDNISKPIAVELPSSYVANTRLYKTTSPSMVDFRLKTDKQVVDNIPLGGKSIITKDGDMYILQKEFIRVNNDGTKSVETVTTKEPIAMFNADLYQQKILRDMSSLSAINKKRLDDISKIKGVKDPQQLFNK